MRRLPSWWLLVAAILCALVSVFALRANNQTMIRLREAVFTADRENGDVETALKELREFVYAHMNTNLAAGENAIRPPIQLKYRYERLLEQEQAKAQAEAGNANLYTEAQEHCERMHPSGFSGSNRLPCIRDYLDTHGAQPQEDIVIPEDLYKFDFISPTWSPDLAGWSIVATVLFLMLFMLRLGSEYIIKRQLG